jgi:WD40 repeat protein
MARHFFWRITTAPTTLLGVALVAGVIVLVRTPAPEGRDLAWPFRPDCCGTIDTLGFSADGTALTASGSGGAIASWDVESGEALGSTRLAPAYSLSHALAADGKTLAAVSWDNAVMIRDLEESPNTRPLAASRRVISAVAFSHDGKTLAEAGQDGTIELIDLAGNRPVRGALRGAKACIVRLAFSPDGTLLAAGDRAGTATLWDTATGQIKAVLERDSTVTIPGQRTAVCDLAFSSDGTELAVVRYFDTAVRRWDVVAGRELTPLRGHDRPVSAVAYAPGEGLIVSGAADGTVKLWDAATSQECASFRGHLWQVSALAFSPDGHLLASADADSSLTLWDLDRVRETKTAHRPEPAGADSLTGFDPRQDHDGPGLGAVSRRMVSRLLEAARSRFSSPPPPRSGEHIS